MGRVVAIDATGSGDITATGEEVAHQRARGRVLLAAHQGRPALRHRQLREPGGDRRRQRSRRLGAQRRDGRQDVAGLGRRQALRHRGQRQRPHPGAGRGRGHRARQRGRRGQPAAARRRSTVRSRRRTEGSTSRPSPASIAIGDPDAPFDPAPGCEPRFSDAESAPTGTVAQPAGGSRGGHRRPRVRRSTSSSWHSTRAGNRPGNSDRRRGRSMASPAHSLDAKTARFEASAGGRQPGGKGHRDGRATCRPTRGCASSRRCPGPRTSRNGRPPHWIGGGGSLAAVEEGGEQLFRKGASRTGIHRHAIYIGPSDLVRTTPCRPT